MPYMEATLITLAAGAAVSNPAVSRHMSRTLIRLTSMTRRKSLSDCSRMGRSSQIPALLTRTSSLPSACRRSASPCRWRFISDVAGHLVDSLTEVTGQVVE